MRIDSSNIKRYEILKFCNAILSTAKKCKKSNKFFPPLKNREKLKSFCPPCKLGQILCHSHHTKLAYIFKIFVAAQN